MTNERFQEIKSMSVKQRKRVLKKREHLEFTRIKQGRILLSK